MLFIRQNSFAFITYILVVVLILFNINNFFFWDTVQLGSAHANYYLSTNFTQLLLPEDIDSGHIPAFGMYVALIWKIFGKSLEISHLAMLPFAVGIVWQLTKICKKFVSQSYYGVAVVLIILDPTILSQITLISPDIMLMFFFLLGVNAVIENQKTLITISTILLFLTSMRGMMVSLAIFFLDFYYIVSLKTNLVKLFQNLLKRTLIYSPAIILFTAFNIYHFLTKGWVGFHSNSPWAESFEQVDFKGFIFNLGILSWRILDFGRIGVWLVLLFLFLSYKKQIKESKKSKILFLFAMCIIVILSANMVWAKNLLAHRYLIPFYIIVALLGTQILFSNFVKDIHKISLTILWIIFLISGNFWIYPTKIAQGWDSTLAHLPYYSLRLQTIKYLEEKNINFNDVQSFFPNTRTIDLIDLNKDNRNFNTFDGKGKYVIFSNVFNVNDEVYKNLIKSYIVIKEFRNNRVFILILQKRL